MAATYFTRPQLIDSILHHAQSIEYIVVITQTISIDLFSHIAYLHQR